MNQSGQDAGQYLDINRALWDGRVAHHLHSEFYALDAFRRGDSSLKEIELALLGDIKGKSLAHLQCHFGQDTLSLARMGAQVVGIDFSPKAIHQATALADELALDAQFICADVHDAATQLPASVDIVFTTYGVLGWLPDIRCWAQAVADCLRPGGELLLVEFHPMIWMYDNDFIRPTYAYFNAAPIIEEEEGTYADTSAPIKQMSVSWNHAIGEVFGALRAAGLQVTHLEEYNYSPYPIFKDNVSVGKDRWGIKGLEGMLPLVYSLKAIK